MADVPSSEMGLSESNRVPLTTALFEQARERYLDEVKPDPLAKRQIQALSLNWSDLTRTPAVTATTTEAAGKDTEVPTIEGYSTSASTNPTNRSIIEGTLEIGGEYLVATIKAVCNWTTNPNDPTGKSGSLQFSLSARCRFWTKSELKRQQQGDGNAMEGTNSIDEDKKEAKKNAKAMEKIRAKMIPRLTKDSYISKLLSEACDIGKQSSTADDAETYRVLAEATIRQDHHQQDQQNHLQQLEERVDVTDNTAEGLRRAIFSSFEGTLDVIELLLYFPYLPKTTNAPKMTTTPLADRASLRLLEDAMFDACEREGEDEIIEDLSLDADGKDVEKEEDELNRNTKRKKTKR